MCTYARYVKTKRMHTTHTSLSWTSFMAGDHLNRHLCGRNSKTNNSQRNTTIDTYRMVIWQWADSEVLPYPHS